MGLREDILSIDDRKTEELYVERWNKTLRIRELDGVARDQITTLYIRQSQSDPQSKLDVPPGLFEYYVYHGVVDEAGNQLFTLEDIAVLRRKNGEVVKFIAEAVQKLSGMAPDSLEEARKNFGSDQSADSGSAFP